MDSLMEIPLEQIEWPDPIRAEINEKDIENMARSILAGGIIHPIIVEMEPVKDNMYNGIVGRLRFEGAIHAGRTTILCRVHSFMEDSERKAWQLIENVVRRPLNAIHLGEGYKKLYDYYKKEGADDQPIMDSMQEQIQKAGGAKAQSRKTIYQYMQFAKDFPEDVKAILKSLTGQTFGMAHALQLLRLKEDHKGLLRMAEYIRDEKPSKRQLKQRVDDYLKVRVGALEPIRQAVEDEEISLKTAAVIADAQGDVQEPVLKLAKEGAKDEELRKVVSFTREHVDKIPLILQEPEKAIEFVEEQTKAPANFFCQSCAASVHIDWENKTVKGLVRVAKKPNV